MIHKRKGMTLAEICVILAVISIVSLSVVSFVTMVSVRSSASAAKLSAMGEMELVEGLVDNWFTVMARDGGKIQNQDGQWLDNPVSINGNRLDGLRAGYVCMEGSEIKLRLPTDTRETAHALDTIRSLRFSAKEREDENGNVVDVLYYCTITCVYTVNKQEKTQSYTFCVNPRLGETVTLPTQPPADGN